MRPTFFLKNTFLYLAPTKYRALCKGQKSDRRTSLCPSETDTQSCITIWRAGQRHAEGPSCPVRRCSDVIQQRRRIMTLNRNITDSEISLILFLKIWQQTICVESVIHFLVIFILFLFSPFYFRDFQTYTRVEKIV